jgi:hypothetical protein
VTWTELLAELNGLIGRLVFVQAQLKDGQVIARLSGILNLAAPSHDPRNPDRDVLFCSLTPQGESGEEEYEDGEIIPVESHQGFYLSEHHFAGAEWRDGGLALHISLGDASLRIVRYRTQEERERDD